MTATRASEHGSADGAVAGAPADDRSTVLQLEWVRRRVAATHPVEADRISSVISAAATASDAAAALSDEWTTSWLAVAVLLVDRQAPVRLPDGQLRAHLRSVTNLLAAVVLPGGGVATVRFDANGVAELPGTKSAIRGPRDLAGTEVTLGPGLATLPDALELVERPGSDVRQDPASQREAGPLAPDEPESPGPQRRADPAAPKLQQLRDSWARAGGAELPANGPRPAADTPGPGVVAALRSMRLDDTVPANRPEMRTLRADQAFDHLSLMSVLEPDRFEEIVTVARRDGSRSGRRLAAHGSYIARRFDEAADAYAELLLDDPGDLDLWRDLIWAMRHAGLDTSARWVLHRDLVTSAAPILDWCQDTGGPLALDDDTSPRDRVVAFLEWVWSDLDHR